MGRQDKRDLPAGAEAVTAQHIRRFALDRVRRVMEEPLAELWEQVYAEFALPGDMDCRDAWMHDTIELLFAAHEKTIVPAILECVLDAVDRETKHVPSRRRVPHEA